MCCISQAKAVSVVGGALKLTKIHAFGLAVLDDVQMSRAVVLLGALL